jgi:hypothetical protein
MVNCPIELKFWIPVEEKTGILMVTSDLRCGYWLMRKTVPNNRQNRKGATEKNVFHSFIFI